MATALIQPSFAAGELSPQLFARVDIAKQHVGAARIYNAFVDYRGGLTSRPGTRFVGVSATPKGSTRISLIRFQFSVLQTYMLELGDLYLRVVKNGGYVLAPDGTPYQIATPWHGEDVQLLRFAQVNDVMTLSHPRYPSYDLARFADADWRLSQVSFKPTIAPPSAGLHTTYQPPLTTTETVYVYRITSVDTDGSESVASYDAYAWGDNFNKRQQSIQVVWDPVPGAAYYNVYKMVPFNLPAGQPLTWPAGGQAGYIGSTRDLAFTDTNITPDFARTPPLHKNPFAIGAITAVTVGNFGNGYDVTTSVSIADPTGTGFQGSVIIQDGHVKGVLIKDPGENYTAPVVSFASAGSVGSGADATATVGPQTGVYPGVVTYFQQRKVFAASYNLPSTWWASKPGAFTNMDVSLPTNAGDALQVTLASLEQNPIKHMVPVQNGLIMLTGGAAWLVSGGDNNTALTATSIKATPQDYNGSADVPPLLVGQNILYLQEKGHIVQDFKYDFFSNTYSGTDRTYLSTHLFDGRTLVGWAWAQQPFKLVWAVMSDGRMLSLTYIREQEVFAWAQHETQGKVLAMCVIPEGDEDVLYLAVERQNGVFIERMISRYVSSVRSAWCLDAALSYNGAPTAVLGGLAHLEGMTVVYIADGGKPQETVVAGGQIQLAAPASGVLVGLGYGSEFQSLYMDAGDPTIQGKRKKITAVTMRLVQAKGLYIGSTFNTLVPVKDTTSTDTLVSQDVRVVMDLSWNRYGQVCVRGSAGLPWTMTAIIPEAMVGDTND